MLLLALSLAATLAPDPDFAPRAHAVGPSDDELGALAAAPDGGAYLAGTVWGDDGRSSLAVLKLDSHGRPDREFGSAGKVLLRPTGASAGARAIAVHDGRVIVAGYAFVGSQTDAVFVRLLEDGALDPEFGEDGVRVLDAGAGSSDGINALVERDGGVIGVGYFREDLALRALAVRLDGDGDVDATFAQDGLLPLNVRGDLDELVAVAVDPRGDYVAVGRSHEGYSDRSGVLVVRFDDTGQLDPGFGEGGVALVGLGAYGFDEGTSLVVDELGIAVGATVESGQLAGDLDLGVALLDDDGALVEATVFSLTARDDGGDDEALAALARDDDGGLVFAGRSGADVVVGRVDEEVELIAALQTCSIYDEAVAFARGDNGIWLGLKCWQGFEHDFGVARLRAPTPAPAVPDSAPPARPGPLPDENASITEVSSGCDCASAPPGEVAGLLALLALSSRGCRRRRRSA
jgi:uncharacterized delta-60 repeat protein